VNAMDSGTDQYVERPETLMRQNVVVIWPQMCYGLGTVAHIDPMTSHALGELAVSHSAAMTSARRSLHVQQ